MGRKTIEDDVERRTWQNPERILTNLGLKPGFVFVDIGCGDGFFALPAAKIAGLEGKVLGIDIDKTKIARLKDRARYEGLSNIHVKVGRAENTALCEACADIVFFGIVLHDFADLPKVLTNAKRMLKPAGRLVDLDWKKEPMEVGPPLHIRFSPEQAIEQLRRAGFNIESIRDSPPYHYLITSRTSAHLPDLGVNR